MHTLDEIVITRELQSRFARPANLLNESKAEKLIHDAAQQGPYATLRSLCKAGRLLTGAGTVGVSLAGPQHPAIWQIVEGQLRRHEGLTLPANSLISYTLDRYTPQLMAHPERYFDYLAALNTPIAEALIIPLHRTPLLLCGVVWLFKHEAGTRFDLEDVRAMTHIAQLASTTLQTQGFFRNN